MAGVDQPRQGDVTEPLGQFKSLWPSQVEVMTPPTGRQAEAWGAIPEKAKRLCRLEQRQLDQWIHPLKREGHGEDAVIAAMLRPAAQGRGQQVWEPCSIRAGSGSGLHPTGEQHRAAQMYGPSFGL